MLEICILNHVFQLLPENALFWKEKQILIVADIHIGKVLTMQKWGMPIPEGVTQNDLLKLKDLILKVSAKRCIIVGDLIHSKFGLSEKLKTFFSDWLKNLPCEVDLVYGNHDRSLIKYLPKEWSLKPHFEQLILPPFCFAHIPFDSSEYFVWSGHVHPQYLMRRGKESIALKCFHIKKNQGILPAFSSFVGGSFIKKNKESRLFVVASNEVLEL